MARFWLVLFVVCPIVTALPAPTVKAAESSPALVEEGNRLAALLRVGRGVVSSNQDLINDPAIGDKGLSSDAFLEIVDAQYRDLYGAGPLDGGLTPGQLRLTQAQLDAMAEVVDENQALINTKGMAFKGFIPAVFARLVNERFLDKVGDAAQVKVTAPPELVRNRKARPDPWETAVLGEKFSDPAWPRGEPYFEELDSDGTPVFRMLIPEYYGASCLTCHGSPKGEVDVTGFPKEGGEAGDLAGAISITLTR